MGILLASGINIGIKHLIIIISSSICSFLLEPFATSFEISIS
jgi:hypothetical protein